MICPDTDRLRELLAGQVDQAEQQGLIVHIDSCPACQEALARLAAGTTLASIERLQQRAGAGILPAGLRPLRDRPPTPPPPGAEQEEAMPIVFPGAPTEQGPLGQV